METELQNLNIKFLTDNYELPEIKKMAIEHGIVNVSNSGRHTLTKEDLAFKIMNTSKYIIKSETELTEMQNKIKVFNLIPFSHKLSFIIK